MTNQRQELFNSILPEDGLLCVTGLMRDKSAPPVVKYFDMGDPAAHDCIDELDSSGRDVYFSTASMRDASQPKSAHNVLGKKCFYLDLDCAKREDDYQTKKEAFAALTEFCKAIHLPDPTLVDSGNGLHAYWSLVETIDYNEWKPIATALKKKTIELGLKADSACTADGARILRVPYTTNKRYTDTQKMCIVKGGVKPDIHLSVLTHAIGYVKRGDYESSTADPVMSVLLGRSRKFKFSRIYKKSLETEEVIEKVEEIHELEDGSKIVKFANRKVERSSGCPQIAYAVANSEILNEPMWRAALSTANCCIDRLEAIEAVSKGHPGYDPAGAVAYAEEHTNGGLCCAEWREVSLQPQLCSVCIHRGKISNPLNLGVVIEEATPEDNIFTAQHYDLGEEVTVEIPHEYPFPWMRPKEGGVALRGAADRLGAEEPAKDDDDPDELMVYPRDLWMKSRLRDGEQEYVEMALRLPNDGLVEFKAPLALMLKQDKCQEILNSKGCAVVGKRATLLRSYIAAWANKLQDESKASSSRAQFGWCDNNTRFVIGNREIDIHGNVIFSPVAAAIENVARIYRKEGNLEEWSRMANAYGAKGNEARAFCLFQSFGAPLYKFIGEGSMITHLTNIASGVGKSTAQRVSLSVWGNPAEGMLTNSDTINAKLHRMGILCNVPAQIDEITNMRPEQASPFAFDLAAGRGKNRMKSHSNEERINESTWSTIIQTSGNNSLYDILRSHKSIAEGEMYRILEIAINQDDKLSKREADAYYTHILPRNFGIAGEEYMKHVVPNIRDIEGKLLRTRDKFDAEMGMRSKERFFSACMAAAFTGGQIANDMGLIRIPFEPVWEWAMQALEETREMIEKVSVDKEGAMQQYISRFWNENISDILMTQGEIITSSQHVDDNLFELTQAAAAAPKRALKGRFDAFAKRLYIQQTVLDDWITDTGVASHQVIRSLKDLNCIVGEISFNLGKGTRLYSTGEVPVFVIDTTTLDNTDTAP